MSTRGGFRVSFAHSSILILECLRRGRDEDRTREQDRRLALPIPARSQPDPPRVDLDGDGWLEVVAVCRQRRYFPTEVLVYLAALECLGSRPEPPRIDLQGLSSSTPNHNPVSVPRGQQQARHVSGSSARCGWFRRINGERRSKAVPSVRMPRRSGGLGSMPSGGLNDYVPLVPQTSAPRVRMPGRSIVKTGR